MGFSDFNSYYYEDSPVLKNKLGIMTETGLEYAVNEYAAVGMAELSYERIPDVFDAGYLKHIHKVLLSDVYEWAGEYRTCDMARNHVYCSPFDIPEEMGRFCRSFSLDFINTNITGKNDMADILSYYWGRLNKIHPFRDGNGRSQFIFFDKACRTKGYSIEVPEADLAKVRTARDSASAGNDMLLSGILGRSLVRVCSSVEKAVSYADSIADRQRSVMDGPEF